MNNATTISIVIGLITLVMSVSVSMFISGSRWGQVQSSLRDLEKDRVRHADIASVRDRLSRIEAIFTLTLKDGGK